MERGGDLGERGADQQGTLDGRVGYDDHGVVLDADYPTASGYGEYSYFKPREAYAREQKIRRAEEELRERFRNQETQFTAKNAFGGVTGGLSLIGGLGVLSSPVAALGYSAAAVINTVAHMASGLASSDGVPDRFAKRDLVNCYVWNADGGFDAETTAVTEARQETKTGAFKVTSTAASTFSVSAKVATESFGYELNGTMGGGLSRTKAKSECAKTSFSVEVAVDVPGDLQQFNPEDLTRVYEGGKPVIVPGKVDAYRFMTFYLHGDAENGADLFNKVIDPIWLEQSSHPNAAAMRQARAAAAEPACWRVYHRVTFVSRILPPLADPLEPAENVEQALSEAQIESNWVLIERMRPFVQAHTGSFPSFRDAVFAAIDADLPELVDYKQDVLPLLCDYFGVPF